MTTQRGDVIAVERKDCKGDPELALDESEMRVKASNLMQFGGLSEADSQDLCDEVLSLPGNPAATPTLFGAFIQALGVCRT